MHRKKDINSNNENNNNVSNDNSKPNFLRFPVNRRGAWRKVNFSNKYHLIDDGEVPEELKEVVTQVVEKLYSNRNIDKTCSFYIVKNEEVISVWVALSGEGSQQTSNDMKFKLKDLDVHFVPFAQKKTSIQKNADNSKSDIVSRTDLFDKFLMAAISAIARPDASADFANKFNLGQQTLNYLTEIRNLITSNVMKEAYNAYLSSNSASRITLVQFMTYMFFRGRMSDQLIEGIEAIAEVVCIVNGKETKDLKLYEEAIYGDYKKHISTKFSNVENFSIYLQSIWDNLSGLSDLEISQKLAHCAENNLIEFLYENGEILLGEGQHYIFSVKISDHNHQIYPLCDVCKVNFPAYLKDLGEKNGVKIELTDLRAIVPVIPLSSTEIDYTLDNFKKGIARQQQLDLLVPLFYSFDRLSSALNKLNMTIVLPKIVNDSAKDFITESGWRLAFLVSRNKCLAAINLNSEIDANKLVNIIKQNSCHIVADYSKINKNCFTVSLWFNKNIDVQKEISSITTNILKVEEMEKQVLYYNVLKFC